MRRGSLIQLAVLGIIAAAVATAVALLVPWLPPAAGKEATRIHFVFWFTTAICIGVFAVVASVLTYSVWKFRVKPDDDSDGPPTHGHTKLEIVWTAVPAVLVTAISIVSAIVLAQNGNAGSNPLIIKVTAQQFAWSFTYPNGKTYGYLTLPKGRHTKLDITSNDVIHSFWVPELSQKQDAVPGQHTHIVVTPTRTGNFPVICTELCGLGHALMRSHADVVTPAKFADFMKNGASAGPPGLAVFQQNGCNSCHTFKPANANGKVGPDLDNLAADAKKANRGALDAFVRESIVDPGAYLEPGYQDAMPHIFKDQIPADQLDKLVQYLVKGSSS
ncbi:MAG TPA: cytochrome c oxidase subunit II [Gaiellaceae bacterium]|nr:cytochrome c oxidase subunit II [Gaiellaceae bacterium]